MDLTGLTALVTGASSGIGEQYAHALAARGADLVLAARRAEKLSAVREAVLQQHPDRTVDVVVADLAQPGAATQLVENLWQPVGILVNNAGVGSHGKFADDDAATSAAMVQLNCTSLVELTGLLLPQLIADGRGAVINVASTAGFQPVPTMAVYAASKAFVLSFTEALGAETRGTGVAVQALCPGATETEFFDRTGKNFLTNRQSAASVVEASLDALGRGTTVVPGTMNKLRSMGSRVVPRWLMPALAERAVAEH